MKLLFIISLLAISLQSINATDPIKKKKFYIEFDLSYPYYINYNQVAFQKNGIGLGGGMSIGHQSFPIYLTYFYQSPLTFAYRNNKLIEQYHELAFRVNMNSISYVIPYGVDPYIGAGLLHKTSDFKQYSIKKDQSEELLSSYRQTSMNYKLTTGVKFGNQNIIIGLQYDYLPSKFVIPNPENQDLTLFNSQHIFTVRASVRISPSFNGKKVKCPRFNKKTKRTLAF